MNFFTGRPSLARSADAPEVRPPFAKARTLRPYEGCFSADRIGIKSPIGGSVKKDFAGNENFFRRLT